MIMNKELINKNADGTMIHVRQSNMPWNKYLLKWLMMKIKIMNKRILELAKVDMKYYNRS